MNCVSFIIIIVFIYLHYRFLLMIERTWMNVQHQKPVCYFPHRKKKKKKKKITKRKTSEMMLIEQFKGERVR